MISIFVWKPGEKTAMGHASMLIFADDAAKKEYVSWYPAEKGAGDAFVFGVEFCSQGKFYKSLKDELKAEWGGKRPDLAVTIRGLNEEKMKKSWSRLKGEDQWCLAKRNCSTVLYILLRAGGAPKADQIHDSDKLQWAEEDKLAGKLASLAKNAWTPIRLYNYANAVSQMATKK